MRSILLTLALLGSARAGATMYVAAFNPQTGETGLIYSSSGGHFWQTLVKGKGLAGAQNYGLCDEATPEEFLNQGMTAADVVKNVKAQCDAADYHSYRFLVVTADGQIDYVIGRDGCSIPDCGARRGNNVVVTGGGLEKGVLDAAIAAYEAQDPKYSFTCRMFRTLREIYLAGGEEKEFMGASVIVDNPAKADIFNIRADIFGGGVEEDLLKRLDEQLVAAGENCL
jgi:hypothetical protein